LHRYGIVLKEVAVFSECVLIDVASPIDRDFQNCRCKAKLLALADAGKH
jgi:hypothetical protein